MADENWQKVRKVFDSALRRKPEERRKFVIEICGGDKLLLAEVESLLLSLDSAEDFMETPAVAKVADVIEAETKKLETGKCFGHYEIVRQIGAGGMGEVYLARDKKLNRQVAVKILNEKFSRDESNLRRFISEAKAASALNHPNILVIHEIGEADDAHYIVSEFIKGKTLREILKEKTLELSEVLDVSIQIANALCTAHEARLIHRDIKPENIMIRPDGYVKVLDFGLAKLVEQKNQSILGLEDNAAKQNQTAKGIILGTVNYMSPEQAKGERVDERTDVFSFGVVLYEMLAGRTPFAGDSVSETFANLINQEPQPLVRFAEGVPDELQRIVFNLLRKNKDERYQTIKDVLTDLKDLREKLSLEEKSERSAASENGNATAIRQATTGSVNKQTAETQYSFSQKIKRHKPLAASALAALLSVGVLAGIGFVRYQSANLPPPILSASFASEKLSTNGKVLHAVVSSDGKNVVYINGIEGRQSIWLRQLESANNIEIIPTSNDVYGGLALSPDGDFIYFARRPKYVEGQLDIYRVSIFGGVPQKIIDEAQGWISLSTDGEKLSFVRCFFLEEEYCSLWIADSKTGKNERKLAARPSPFRIGDNEISPDGKTVAFAVGQSKNAANEFGLNEVDIESGAERELTTQKFFDIKSLAWLPDRNGLFVTASRVPNKTFRIWQVSAASGDVELLTNDSETYFTLSLNKNADVLVSTQVKADFRLNLYQTENSSAAPRVLADASSVAFAPNGKIIFSSLMTGNDEIWSINADGSEQKQLTNDAADESAPVVSPAGNSIFFMSNRTGEAHVWRMNADGSNQTQITQTEGGYPLFVSPDGKWLYYHHGLHRNLWRVSTTGGEEQLVLDKRKSYFAFSPDGLQAAFSEQQGEEEILTIVSLADGRTIKAFRLADGKAHLLNIAWLPDEKNLAYILKNTEDGNKTLWRQPLDEEQPRQITVLGDEEIASFTIAHDGKSFAIVQGSWRHDAVLLKGVR